jgi:hypothetical protein
LQQQKTGQSDSRQPASNISKDFPKRVSGLRCDPSGEPVELFFIFPPNFDQALGARENHAFG